MSFEPKVLGILCNWCSYAGADLAGTARKKYSPNVRVVRVMCSGRVEIEAAVAAIDEELCSGCKICNLLCPYNAISFDEEKKICRVNEVLCKGCGACVAACPSGVITAKHFTTDEIMAEVEGILV